MAQTTFQSRAFVVSSYHPVAAPEFIEVLGYDQAGDGPRLTYIRNGTPSGDLVVTQADSTSVGYDQMSETYNFETATAVTNAKFGHAKMISTEFYDTNNVPGAGSIYIDAGTTNPNQPGQLSVLSQGVTHFYTRANSVLRPQQHGCRSGGNASVNRAALQKTLEESDWHGGREIDMGTANDIYEIDGGLVHGHMAKPIIRGSGATIKLSSVSANSQAYCLCLVTSNLGFDIEGVTIDGNRKTPNPLWIENDATVYSDANVHDARAVGVTALNGYRRVVGDSGGRGIRITGYYRHVLLEDVTIKGMALGAGAGIAGTVGIIGLFVGLRGAVSDDAPLHVDIVNPHIDKVFSEDPAYPRDQDGISLLFPWPSNNADRKRHAVNIRGGRIIDACTRGIKAQIGLIDVSGTLFEARDIPTPAPSHNMMIDFQCGSGIARGIRGLAHNATGWTYGVLSNPPVAVNGTVIVDDMVICGIGTPRPMSAMVYKASTATGVTSPGAAILCNSGTENFSLAHGMHYQDKSNGQSVARVVNNSFREITTSGILMEGGTGTDIVTAIFSGNSHFASFVPMKTHMNCTPTLIGAANENYLFY